MASQAKSPVQRVTRRNFLNWMFGVTLVALFGQAGTALLKYFKPRIEPGAFGGKIVAGQVAEFQPNTVSHISKGRFFISRLEDGGMLAMWQRCTHLGCTVPWREGEHQFHCPCHSSLFNTKGEVIGGPAPRPLDLFPIEIVNGQVVVDTGTPIEREKFDPSQETQV
ncbi:MAG: Rieske 2Fe-2S domain-containing protein [Anaerolineae bacterium]|nr:Rieske 2Fe-2S domain-containing protein [Anaerolineae bacterium]